MPPSQRARPSPYDRFTGASASAVKAGFAAAMALGPQPKLVSGNKEHHSAGTEWLRDLQDAAGLSGGGFSNGASSGLTAGLDGDDEDLSDEEDNDSEDDSLPSGKRKGRKSRTKVKGSKVNNEESTAAQRKAQNRLAQREFRQRKQQYIKALETKVELLSTDHDTQVDRLRYALRGLLAENNQLRSLLGCMTAFVGTEMLGGPLQKAGISRKELEAIIMSTSEKTMTERWEHWPGAQECEALTQIRLEVNLPAEGLPDTYRSQGGSSARRSTAPVISEQSSKTKRKSTAVEDVCRFDSQKHPKMPERTESDPTQDTFSSGLSVEASAQQSLATDIAVAPERLAPEQSLDYSTLYSLLDVGSGSNLSNTNANPAFNGINLFSPSSTSADSNAILASLFGASSMPGMFGQSPSSNYAQYEIVSQNPASNLDTSMSRQKTIANIEEPEEIKRIRDFAQRLRTSKKAVDESQLTSAVNGISQLIHQMASFRRQPSYQLPALLLPSDIQQTRPHDPLIDSLPFSGLRQRLILLQDGLLMDDVLSSFLLHIRLHSDDPTDVQQWELDVGFFLQHRHLVDKDTLEITNTWRRSRDEKPMNFSDLSKSIR